MAQGHLKSKNQDDLGKPLLDTCDTNSNRKVEARGCETVTPYASAGFFRILTFSWLNPLLALGAKETTLELDDVPQLDRRNSIFEAFPVLQNRLHDNVAKNSSSRVAESMLVKALFLSAWKEILWTAILSIIFTLALYVPPYLIDSFVQCLNGQESFRYQGYILALTFPIATLVEGFIQKHSAFKLQQIGIRLRAATTVTIFNKFLKSSNRQISGGGSGNGGEVINAVAVDVETLNNFICGMHDPWLIILQITLALLILNKNLGIIASVTALAMQVCFVLLNSVYVRWEEKFQRELMECKDNRMKVTMETLRNMRILKLQGWQTSFLSKIFQLRKVEVSWLKKYLYFSAMMDAFYGVTSTLVALAAFGSCYLTGIPLETGMILSALATLAALQAPVNHVPETFSMLIQAKVSVRRIASILSHDQLQDNALEKLPLGSSDIAIEIVNGNFNWDELDTNSVTLKDINLKVFHGMRVAICGTVGSGKSSLLSSILGEIPKISGTVSVCGSTAYVAQSPWIQSGTVQENILFGKVMDSERYEKVLEACCLNKDLEILPYGDQTIIGERGINLSGGQKQRVQIARTLYHDADIFLFDDPFSAVDAHTGSHLFKEVLLGLLSKKTVVYVTHQVEFLNAADLILVMKDGRISQVGKYTEILFPGSDFMQLVGAQNAALSAVDSVINEGIVELEREDKSLQNGETDHEGAAAASLQSAAQLIKEEEREKGKVGFQVYWQYITTTYGGSLLLLSILGNIVCRFLRIGSSFWLAWAAPMSEDDIPPVDASTLMMVYACLAVAISLCNLAAEMLRVTAGYKTATILFTKMMERIFSAPMSFFDATPSGRILSRCSSDQKALEIQIPSVLDGLTYYIIALLGIIILMAAVSWEVLFIFIPMFLLSLWYQRYYMPTSRELTRLSGVCQAPITQYFSETITGITTIRAFDQASRFQTTYMKVIESYSRPEFHLAATLKWLLLRLDVFACITFAFLLVLSVYFAEGIDPAITGLAVTYGLTLSNSIAAVTRCLCTLENRMISLERILQYTSIPSEAPLVIQENSPGESWPSCGEVNIHDLEVRYAPHLPIVLHGVTCTFQGGSRTGIVGRTGSGKSTLIQALFRIVEPTSGRIVIDGIDISKIGLQDLRSRLSIIPQDPTMFQGTIRSNLDPLEQYTDEQIWEALDKCQLGEEVRKTEKKLDSIVNENGENWSMGQRQLVCLGRVLVKKSKVLVLDEATASVDTATDNLIQQTLKHHFYGCTIITIAHRITSILDSDMVLLLDDGFVKEYDSPGKLLQKKSSLFAQLVAEYTARSSNSQHFDMKSTRDQ